MAYKPEYAHTSTSVHAIDLNGSGATSRAARMASTESCRAVRRISKVNNRE